ncbi:MAG: type II toxin-antitoxin system VapC family toxin [Sporichthyaceae bacterium]
MLICDTGPLVAAAVRRDPDHRACVDLFTGARLAGRRLIVPAPVIAEVGYLLGRHAGTAIEVAFLRSVAAGDFQVEAPTEADFTRASDLVERYADLPPGTTDAIVVATAERLDCSEVATLDRRDFSVVRPKHVSTLTLLP